jgi:hypothetical protein
MPIAQNHILHYRPLRKTTSPAVGHSTGNLDFFHSHTVLRTVAHSSKYILHYDPQRSPHLPQWQKARDDPKRRISLGIRI